MNANIYRTTKYVLDRPLALLLLVLAAPLMLIFAVIIMIELKASPVIIQERGLSLKKCRIKIYKLRTLKKHSADYAGNVRNIFEKHYLESYVPPFCRLLRQTGLDELPQLVNVIKGEMSLIGPRPLTLSDLKIIKNNDSLSYDVLNKLTARPGITGYWQVYGSRSQGAANMIWLHEYYDKNVSFLLDVKIFLSTLPLIMFGQHSDTIVVKQIEKSRRLPVKSLSNS